MRLLEAHMIQMEPVIAGECCTSLVSLCWVNSLPMLGFNNLVELHNSFEWLRKSDALQKLFALKKEGKVEKRKK